MNRILLVTFLGVGFALMGSDEIAEAGHGCGYGGFSYGAPVYSYPPAYAYAPSSYGYVTPAFSYAPTYQSAYVQPSLGYGSSISIGFGHGHSVCHGGHWSGHGSHFSDHHLGGHHGGGHHGGWHH